MHPLVTPKLRPFHLNNRAPLTNNFNGALLQILARVSPAVSPQPQVTLLAPSDGIGLALPSVARLPRHIPATHPYSH